MAAQVARRHLANNSDRITQARHTEIALRYAWQARQRRKRHEDKPDMIVAAHHFAFLRGDVIKHILGWARAWAPWTPSAEAERLAERVTAEPRKWTADALAWRLRLSMAERTELRIDGHKVAFCSRGNSGKGELSLEAICAAFSRIFPPPDDKQSFPRTAGRPPGDFVSIHFGKIKGQ